MPITTSSAIEQFKSTSNIFKKAELVDYLYREKQLKLKDIANQVGLKPSYLSQLLPILDLPAYVMDGYYAKQLSGTHLMLLARLNDENIIHDLYSQILENKLSTYETEEYIRNARYNVHSHSTRISPNELKRFAELLSKRFDVDVKLKQTRIEGKIQIMMKGNSVVTTKKIREIIDKLLSKGYEEPDLEEHLIVLD
ncbi:hypothetical protein KC726_00225 [Candidatus Woesebacteria bacterium]|nr:hypothetical protein [Candidatus Woesebacteria bacterium]